jgi:hypothetical protein
VSHLPAKSVSRHRDIEARLLRRPLVNVDLSIVGTVGSSPCRFSPESDVVLEHRQAHFLCRPSVLPRRPAGWRTRDAIVASPPCARDS